LKKTYLKTKYEKGIFSKTFAIKTKYFNKKFEGRKNKGEIAGIIKDKIIPTKILIKIKGSAHKTSKLLIGEIKDMVLKL